MLQKVAAVALSGSQLIPTSTALSRSSQNLHGKQAASCRRERAGSNDVARGCPASFNVLVRAAQVLGADQVSCADQVFCDVYNDAGAHGVGA